MRIGVIFQPSENERNHEKKQKTETSPRRDVDTVSRKSQTYIPEKTRLRIRIKL